MKKERIVVVINMMAIWLLAPNQTNAQQDTTSVHLSEVVVTATKFPKNVNETAKVLTIIDEAQLARSQGKDLSQVLTEQAGLIINGATSNPGKDKSVFLQGAKSDYTLVLLDGIPLNDPSSLGGGAYDLRLIPIDQIERIEIMKGSQSTLYGSDAIAGVINIFTKKSGDKKIGATGNLGYGTFNSLRGSAGVMGSMKGFNYNIGVSRFQTDGISEAKDSTGAASFDNDGYDQNAIQVNLGITAIPSLSIRPYIRYNSFNGSYDAGSFVDSKKDFYTSRLMNTGVAATYSLKRGAVNFLYGFDRTDRTYDSDFGMSKFYGRFNQAEVFWNHELGKYTQILAGVSTQEINMIDSTTTEKDPKITLTSPYASFFVRGWKGLSAEIGGRYNVHSKAGNIFTYSLNPAYWVNKQVKLFANLSTGFKSPNLSQLYGPFGGNKELKPEQSQSIEGGVQYVDKGGRFDVRVNAFKRDINDVIFYSFDPLTFISKYVNLNHQADHGYEVELNARPNKSVTLRAFYAFVTGEITDKSGSKDTTYNNLFRRPKHTVGFNVGYTPTPKLFVSANVRVVGQRSDLFFNLDTFTNQSVVMNSYALLDIYVEYKVWKEMKLWFDGRNLLNEQYSEVYGYNTQGRNFMVGVSLRF